MQITINELEAMAEQGCDLPDCNHEHNGTVFIHSRCHPESPVWISYTTASELLKVTCSKCRRGVMDIRLGRVTEEQRQQDFMSDVINQVYWNPSFRTNVA
jgi:hypothetical protein